MKTQKTIEQMMKELASLKELETQLKAELETAQDEIKAYMTEAGVDEVVTDAGKVTWREVISNRFDSTAFKKDFSDIYTEYLQRTTYKRFTFR